MSGQRENAERWQNIPSVGAVDAHFVDLGRVFAEILDVTEDVAATILADEIAQIGTQAHVCDGRLVVTPFLHGEALEQNESLSINDVIAQSPQVLCELGQIEVGLYCV